jgi:hypothetical protein
MFVALAQQHVIAGAIVKRPSPSPASCSSSDECSAGYCQLLHAVPVPRLCLVVGDADFQSQLIVAALLRASALASDAVESTTTRPAAWRATACTLAVASHIRHDLPLPHCHHRHRATTRSHCCQGLVQLELLGSRARVASSQHDCLCDVATDAWRTATIRLEIAGRASKVQLCSFDDRLEGAEPIARAIIDVDKLKHDRARSPPWP